MNHTVKQLQSFRSPLTFRFEFNCEKDEPFGLLLCIWEIYGTDHITIPLNSVPDDLLRKLFTYVKYPHPLLKEKRQLVAGFFEDKYGLLINVFVEETEKGIQLSCELTHSDLSETLRCEVYPHDVEGWLNMLMNRQLAAFSWLATQHNTLLNISGSLCID